MTYRNLAISLVAAFALTALAAAPAFGGTYEWCRPHKKGSYADSGCTQPDFNHKNGRPKGHFELEPVQACAPQKHGEFTNATCTARASRPHKGHFEVTTGRTFTVSGGQSVGYTPEVGGFPVICASTTGSGEIEGPKSGQETVTFHGCEQDGQPCTSAGEPSGVIQSTLLDVTLIDHGEQGPAGREPAAGEVWTESAGEPEVFAFECQAFGGVFNVFGSGSGVTSGNVGVLATTSTFALAEGSGEEDFTDTIGGSGPFAATLTGEFTATYATPVEIKA